MGKKLIFSLKNVTKFINFNTNVISVSDLSEYVHSELLRLSILSTTQSYIVLYSFSISMQKSASDAFAWKYEESVTGAFFAWKQKRPLFQKHLSSRKLFNSINFKFLPNTNLRSAVPSLETLASESLRNANLGNANLRPDVEDLTLTS